jgi:hypothetical protein
MTADRFSNALSAAERAETPYLLFPDDLGIRLRIDAEVARHAVLGGHLGPWLLVGGEPVVMRDSFERHLRRRTVQLRAADRELLPEQGGVLLGPGAREEELGG